MSSSAASKRQPQVKVGSSTIEGSREGTLAVVETADLPLRHQRATSPKSSPSSPQHDVMSLVHVVVIEAIYQIVTLNVKNLAHLPVKFTVPVP